VSRPVLFLDDGGVMNDNTRRGRQWQRLAGRYLAPRLGGAPEAWAAANAAVAERLFRAYEAHFCAKPDASWTAYWAGYEEAWLGGMCAVVGATPPVREAARRRLSRACDAYVTRRVRAAFPGAIGAIRWLHRAGYRLHTASGEASWELDGYLIGMRVRTCFDNLYGPDQVDVAKASPLYYQQVFAHAGLAPGDAVVVDDAERALNWAAEVGARTVLCRPAPPTDRRHRHVQRLAEVPRLLGEGSAA
jgi:phosphoglycolate phosphatase-like HAD superfamily hydrolase